MCYGLYVTLPSHVLSINVSYVLSLEWFIFIYIFFPLWDWVESRSKKRRLEKMLSPWKIIFKSPPLLPLLLLMYMSDSSGRFSNVNGLFYARLLEFRPKVDILHLDQKIFLLISSPLFLFFLLCRLCMHPSLAFLLHSFLFYFSRIFLSWILK